MVITLKNECVFLFCVHIADLNTLQKSNCKKKVNQAIAAYPTPVRTHFEALWKRNQRVSAVLKIDAFISDIKQNKILKIAAFELKFLIWRCPF